MNRTVFTPMLVLLGLFAILVLMAGSAVFTPLIRFIHNGNITPPQAAACLAFTVTGFAACFFLLNLLCSYFVPRMDVDSGGSGVTLKLQHMEAENRQKVTTVK